MSGIHHHDGLESSVLLVVGTGATVALDASLGERLRDDIQRAIEEPEPAVAFLSTLTAGGVRDLPRFAYVGREGATARILLRGAFEAIERRSDGTELVHEAGSVSTWTEILRDGCCDISLRIPGGGPFAVVAFTPPPDATPEAACDVVELQERSGDPQTGDGHLPEATSADIEVAAGGGGSATRGEASTALVVEPGDRVALVPGPEAADLSVAHVAGSRVDETMLPADLSGELGTAAIDASSERDAPTSVVPVVDKAVDDEVDLSHLFETRHVGVEAAAVRGEESPVPPGPHGRLAANGPDVAAAGGAPLAQPAPLPPPSGPAVSLPPPPDVPGGSPPAAAHLPPPAGPPVAAPPPAGLIAGVPGVRSEPAVDATAGGSASPSGGRSDPPAGDHDGLTISPAQLAALRQDAALPATPSTPRAAGPQLQAVTCPSGHLNPPQADQCRSCGTAIADRTIRVVARPTLGHLRFDGGMVADVDRPMLIGRKPTVDGLVPGAEVPALVVLPDPDGSLSRVHAEIRLEGWEVLVVDRNSTNGTRVEVPGQPPVLLRPHEPFLVSPGTKITLADIVTCTYQPGPR